LSLIVASFWRTGITQESQVPLWGFGLVVAENIPPTKERERPTSSTVLLTANKFRNHILTNPLGTKELMSQNTVSISNIERCTVTGNLILGNKRGFSLVINGDQQDMMPIISVTGNIFQCSRKLPPHPYSGLPMNIWDFLTVI
jgi:hypothetical protein